MLSDPVQEEIRRSLPEAYRVPMDHPDPDISGIVLAPDIRWHEESFDRPDPPYESVAMYLDPTGVIESDQPTDRQFGREKFNEAEVAEGHAHGSVTTGWLVHDVLNLTVTGRGNATVAGTQYTPSRRAKALANALQNFLLEVWPSRPLDHFDRDGAPIAENDPTLPDTYADELETPIRVRPIPGRGPTDVTEQVDAAGAQIDCAVELAYVDTHTEYEYLVREGVVNETATIDGEPLEPYDTF